MRVEHKTDDPFGSAKFYRNVFRRFEAKTFDIRREEELICAEANRMYGEAQIAVY